MNKRSKYYYEVLAHQFGPLGDKPVGKVQEKRKLKKTKNYLTFDEFLSWVASKPKNEVVGRVSQAYVDNINLREVHPVVTYFREAKGVQDVAYAGQVMNRIKFTENGVKCIINLSGFGQSLFDKMTTTFEFKGEITAGQLAEFLTRHREHFENLERR